MKENDKEGLSKKEFDDNLKKLLNVPPPDKDKRNKKMIRIMDEFIFGLTSIWYLGLDDSVYFFMPNPLTQEQLSSLGGKYTLPEGAKCYRGQKTTMNNGNPTGPLDFFYTVYIENDKIFLKVGYDEPMEFIYIDPPKGLMSLKHPIHGEITFTKFEGK